MNLAAARAALAALPAVALGHETTPVEELPCLRAALEGEVQALILRAGGGWG